MSFCFQIAIVNDVRFVGDLKLLRRGKYFQIYVYQIIS
jgi:hypothetical protein